MTRRWVARFGAVAFVLAAMLGTTSCGQDLTAPETPTVEQTDTELFGLGSWLSRLLGGDNNDGQSGEYTLIKERPRLIGGLLDFLVVDLLGLDGGLLSVLGHSILVPPGAVDRPALFSIEVQRNGLVEVDLTATARDWRGRIIDIGEQGFDEPVTLTLSYERATNVDDPDDLVILRRLPGGGFEELPTTVDRQNKTVSAQLDHFSRYCMATN